MRPTSRNPSRIVTQKSPIETALSELFKLSHILRVPVDSCGSAALELRDVEDTPSFTMVRRVVDAAVLLAHVWVCNAATRARARGGKLAWDVQWVRMRFHINPKDRFGIMLSLWETTTTEE